MAHTHFSRRRVLWGSHISHFLKKLIFKKNICQSNLVLQISNDSWFGKWYGPQQHLANSLLRSVEFGKTLVRSTPSGISAIIDKKGNIIESISNDKKDFLYYNYPLNQSHPFCPSTLNIIMLLLFLIFGSIKDEGMAL